MNTFELYTSKEECCGCGACAVGCPQNAISMTADEYGFLFPCIDNDRCVDCGLCKQVCNFTYKNSNANETKAVYAGILKDQKTLNNSASGGIFAGIAKVKRCCFPELLAKYPH